MRKLKMVVLSLAALLIIMIISSYVIKESTKKDDEYFKDHYDEAVNIMLQKADAYSQEKNLILIDTKYNLMGYFFNNKSLLFERFYPDIFSTKLDNGLYKCCLVDDNTFQVFDDHFYNVYQWIIGDQNYHILCKFSRTMFPLVVYS